MVEAVFQRTLVVILIMTMAVDGSGTGCKKEGKRIFWETRKKIYQYRQANRMFSDKGMDIKEGSDSTHQQIMANGDDNHIGKATDEGVQGIEFTKNLLERKRHGSTLRELQDNKYVQNLAKTLFVSCKVEPPSCEGQTNAYRTADGTCNNIENPFWGAAQQPHNRLIKPDYADGVTMPRKGKDGNLLPNPRKISNSMFAQKHEEILSTHASAMTMQFGQFLDHDMTLTPMSPGSNGSAIDCCRTESLIQRPEACFPFPISKMDPHFRNFDQKCMNFIRSAAADVCPPSTREQMNMITSYIDGSNIYGSNQKETDDLRKFENGLLRYKGDNNLPETDPHECILEKENGDAYCMKAGDNRVNTNPSLQAIHAMLLRYHNVLATLLADKNPKWSDERLFQETRRIVGAVLQRIVYAEFLPVILGDSLMHKYRLYEKESGHDNVYDPKINAAIKNVFAAAAFRFGHSLIINQQVGLNKDMSIDWIAPLHDTFLKAKYINKKSGVDGLIRWCYGHKSQKADRFFADSIRNKMFKNNGVSLDLPSMNMQRGRDHGLPGYNTWRRKFGLAEFHNSEDHTSEVAALLRSLYKNDEDIDVFPGGMSESVVPEGMVGPTFGHIIANQFGCLKFGDRYYFENKNPNDRVGFKEEQVNEIKKMTMSRIICSTTVVEGIQSNSFLMPDNSTNPIVPCGKIPDMDLSHFME